VSQPRRAPKQTELQRLIADAGELTVDALLDGGAQAAHGAHAPHA
jgi:hypothetical protein